MSPTSLTNRQLEVLGAIIATGSYKGAAHRLGISIKTVGNHMSEIREQMGGLSSLQVVHLLSASGALPPQAVAGWQGILPLHSVDIAGAR